MRVIDQETQVRMENAGSLDKYMLYHLKSLQWLSNTFSPTPYVSAAGYLLWLEVQTDILLESV